MRDEQARQEYLKSLASPDCNAVQWMREHNRRAVGAAQKRAAVFGRSCTVSVPSVTQPHVPAWLGRFFGLAVLSGGCRLFGFKIQIGRLLIELRRVDVTLNKEP